MTYVVAALVFILALGASAYGGWHNRDLRAVAEKRADQAEAAQKVAEAKQQNAEVSQKVVTVYKDRIVKIREVPPEVQHDVQVIHDSKCVLPPEWVRLHDHPFRGESATPADTDGAADSVTCVEAIETVRANYIRAQDNAAKLEALQDWAKGVSQ